MKICCVHTGNLPLEWVQNTFADNLDIFQKISNDAVSWIERAVAEQDENYKQLIPYVLVSDSTGCLACYRRQGTESRLHGFYSCGVGGHVDEPDCDISLQATILRGVQRELHEEFQDFDASRMFMEYKGIIHEVQSEVGKYHLGIVFLVKLEPGYRCLPATELAEMRWVKSADLSNINLELWSRLALRLL
jgi:predicted NUDIX family phosphoesterase